MSFRRLGAKGGRCKACYPVYRQAYQLHAIAKYRTAKAGAPFDLTIEWIEERLRLGCQRTGLEFTILHKGGNMRNRAPNSPSLDQIRPGEGYTKDNIQVVTWWYNAAKQRFSDEEVLSLCQIVVQRASSLGISPVPLAALGMRTHSTQMDTPTVFLRGARGRERRSKSRTLAK